MINRLAMVALAAITSIAHAQPINPDVTQNTINRTICVARWTKTVRPPVSYTNALKLRRLAEIGKPASATSDYELDHVVPLNTGGAPYDPNNLRLQLWPEARIKDHVEDCLSKMVCKGIIGLDEARRMIWLNWQSIACRKS